MFTWRVFHFCSNFDVCFEWVWGIQVKQPLPPSRAHICRLTRLDKRKHIQIMYQSKCNDLIQMRRSVIEFKASP